MSVTVGGPEYDHIVVGGGSAGCVVAARLSEDGRRSVLLLEAGGSERRLRFLVPAAVLQLQLTGEHDWRYPAEPDPSRGGRTDGWAAGRVLGGSGSINGMVWVRGHPGDYDGWAAAGCEGWEHAAVVEDFKRCETYAGGDPRYRGRSGPVSVRQNPFHHRLTEAFVSAARAAGHEYNEDYNGARQEGVAHTQYNIGGGLRASTARAYLDRRARRRRNLTMRLRAQALRVRFDGRRATGVEYRHEGRTAVASCRREVIVCAGSIGSPKLLLQSGVGPAAQLREHGIPVVHDAPGVGENLSDHIAASLTFEVDVPSLNTYFTPGRMIRSAAEWVAFRGGPLASGPAHASVHGRSGDSPVSEYEIHLLPFALPGLERGRSVARLVDRFMGYSGLTLVVLGLHPRSRGTVALRSADPDDPPVIRHAQFADPADMTMMLRATAAASLIAEQPPLRGHVIRKLNPGPEVRTEEEWTDWLRAHTHRGLHECGTCAMGRSGEAVVDPELRVHGVQGLRVIDASIMPAVPSGNTNAAAVMIGERGSALVLAGEDRPAPATRQV